MIGFVFVVSTDVDIANPTITASNAEYVFEDHDCLARRLYLDGHTVGFDARMVPAASSRLSGRRLIFPPSKKCWANSADASPAAAHYTQFQDRDRTEVGVVRRFDFGGEPDQLTGDPL